MDVDYSYASLFVLVVTSFLSTSLDNLLLFAFVLQSQPRWKWFAALGYITACAVILTLSVGVALVGGALDGKYVGFLGAVPVVLGVRMLWAQYRGADADRQSHKERSFSSGPQLLFGTAALMLGNSGDSLALFLPLFIDTRPSYYLFLVLSYCLVAAVWILTAYRVATHIGFADRTLRACEIAAPFLMIALGIYIFMDTAADTVM